MVQEFSIDKQPLKILKRETQSVQKGCKVTKKLQWLGGDSIDLLPTIRDIKPGKYFI